MNTNFIVILPNEILVIVHYQMLQMLLLCGSPNYYQRNRQSTLDAHNNKMFKTMNLIKIQTTTGSRRHKRNSHLPTTPSVINIIICLHHTIIIDPKPFHPPYTIPTSILATINHIQTIRLYSF